jgi:hypothetical protein
MAASGLLELLQGVGYGPPRTPAMNGGSTAYTCPSRLGGCCALCSGRSVVTLELRQSANS